MFAGGTEAAVSRLCIGSFGTMKALSTRNDDPKRASRPFDRDRDGFVLAEGAGELRTQLMAQLPATCHVLALDKNVHAEVARVRRVLLTQVTSS